MMRQNETSNMILSEKMHRNEACFWDYSYSLVIRIWPGSCSKWTKWKTKRSANEISKSPLNTGSTACLHAKIIPEKKRKGIGKSNRNMWLWVRTLILDVIFFFQSKSLCLNIIIIWDGCPKCCTVWNKKYFTQGKEEHHGGDLEFIITYFFFFFFLNYGLV